MVGGISTALMPFAIVLGKCLSVFCSITYRTLKMCLGYEWMLFLRIIVGVTAGAMQPCITALIAHWSPEKELSSRLIFVMSGLQLSVFVMNPILASYCRIKDWYEIFIKHLDKENQQLKVWHLLLLLSTYFM